MLANHVFNRSAWLKRIISVNRVRVLNIVLAVFDYVFLLDPSSKSIFAQKQSCRPSLPLQLLFWPNFKLLCENYSFGRSKIESVLPQNPEVPGLETGSSGFALFHLLRRPYRRLCRWRRHASSIPANLALCAPPLSS